MRVVPAKVLISSFTFKQQIHNEETDRVYFTGIMATKLWFFSEEKLMPQ